MRRLKNGTIRFYRFAFEDYPELIEASGFRQNLKRHLFRDMARIGERYAAQEY